MKNSIRPILLWSADRQVEFKTPELQFDTGNIYSTWSACCINSTTVRHWNRNPKNTATISWSGSTGYIDQRFVSDCISSWRHQIREKTLYMAFRNYSPNTRKSTPTIITRSNRSSYKAKNWVIEQADNALQELQQLYAESKDADVLNIRSTHCLNGWKPVNAEQMK
jgi:hypothetical protein